MFKTIRKNIIATFAAISLLVAPAAVVPLTLAGSANAATIQNCLATGVNLSAPQNGNCQDAQTVTNGGTNGVNKLINDIINIFSLIVGVVSVIMIILGGLRYITSGGDSGNVSTAKNTIIYAIIGLVVVALAQVIAKFVVNRVTNAAS